MTMWIGKGGQYMAKDPQKLSLMHIVDLAMTGQGLAVVCSAGDLAVLVGLGNSTQLLLSLKDQHLKELLQ